MAFHELKEAQRIREEFCLSPSRKALEDSTIKDHGVSGKHQEALEDTTTQDHGLTEEHQEEEGSHNLLQPESSTADDQEKEGYVEHVKPALNTNQRLKDDISAIRLCLPMTTTISFPNGETDVGNIEVKVQQFAGYNDFGDVNSYGHGFEFTVQFPEDYPNLPPIVKCKTKSDHPNLDGEGNAIIFGEEEINDVKSLVHTLFTRFSSSENDSDLSEKDMDLFT